MKNKRFIPVLAILLIAASLACVYASEITFDSMKIDVPDLYEQKSANDTAIVFEDSTKEIIISKDIKSGDAANAYLTSKGFTYNDTIYRNETVSGTKSANYNYEIDTYTKDKEAAGAYLLKKDNNEFTIIAIDHDIDFDFDFGSFEDSTINSDVSDIVRSIMTS